MGPVFPKTLGSLMGWMMTLFVIGVLIHSIFFRFVFPSFIGLGAFMGAIATGAMLLDNPCRSRFRLCVLLIASLMIGFLRFEIAPRPTLQRIDTRYLMISAPSETHGIWSVLSTWRAGLTERIGSILPHDEAALLTGILYGERDLSKEQRRVFRSAGLMHIVAVSGSNVTIVIQSLSLFLKRLRLTRRGLFVVSSCALCVFILFVGFSASVVRAAFMGWLILLAREVGRPVLPSRLLLVAATFLLIISPWQLGFDPGFALSFLGMWGLLAWTPVFGRWLSWMPNTFELRQILAMTLGATLMTTPYLAWMFGRVSLAGIVTNAFVLPLLPFVMGSGTVATLWGLTPYGWLVSAPALGLLRTIEWMAGVAASLPWAELQTKNTTLVLVFGWYVLLGYGWLMLGYPHKDRRT